MSSNEIIEIILAHKSELLELWELEQNKNIRQDLMKAGESKAQIKEFFNLFIEAAKLGNFKNHMGAEWSQVRDFLASLSASRAIQGFTPTETALFVFTLKRSLLAKLREKVKASATSSDKIWDLEDTMDKLGLFTTESYQRTREEVINRQQSDMLELSTPVVELAEGIIALPMIGTLDSSRTSVVMETLLQRIVETSAQIAIIDITGVPTVDTLVAQHLLKTVTAAKLMGAECIISGIRPQIAATIVHLGVDLGSVVTKASLASAFQLSLKKTGNMIVKASSKV